MRCWLGLTISDCHGVAQQGKERSQESELNLLKIAESITKQSLPRDLLGRPVTFVRIVTTCHFLRVGSSFVLKKLLVSSCCTVMLIGDATGGEEPSTCNLTAGHT